jgi:hypothetical protein
VTAGHKSASSCLLSFARVGEACDIEDCDEYKAVAKSIIETKPSKPLVLTVELVQIHKHAKVKIMSFLPVQIQFNHHEQKRSRGDDSPESSGNEEDDEDAVCDIFDGEHNNTNYMHM